MAENNKTQLDYLNYYINKNKDRFNKYQKKFNVGNIVNYNEFNELFDIDDKFRTSKKHEYLENYINIYKFVKENIIESKNLTYSNFIEILKIYTFYITPKYKIEGISTTQLRSIYEVVKKVNKRIKINKDNSEIVNEEINKLLKLKLNLAYMQGKNKNNNIFIGFLGLIDIFIIRISTSNEKEDLTNDLYEFLEGIVCYLKYFNEIEGRK